MEIVTQANANGVSVLGADKGLLQASQDAGATGVDGTNAGDRCRTFKFFDGVGLCVEVPFFRKYRTP